MKTEIKKFSWKDKSGRGFTNNNIKLSKLKTWDDEVDWNGNNLHEWADNAIIGETWQNESSLITRTN